MTNTYKFTFGENERKAFEAQDALKAVGMKNVRKTQSKRTIGKKVIYEYNVSVKIEDYEVAREIVLAIKNA